MNFPNRWLLFSVILIKLKFGKSSFKLLARISEMQGCIEGAQENSILEVEHVTILVIKYFLKDY